MRLKKGTSKPRYSLYMDIYYRKGKRKREFLGIYLEPNEDKSYRNEKLKLAENIKAKRMMELFFKLESTFVTGLSQSLSLL